MSLPPELHIRGPFSHRPRPPSRLTAFLPSFGLTFSSTRTTTQHNNPSSTLEQAWEEEEEEETKGSPLLLTYYSRHLLAAPFCRTCECGLPLASPHLPRIGTKRKKEHRNAGLMFASLGVKPLQGRSLGTVVCLPQV